MDDDFFLIEPTKDELRQLRARVCTKCHRMLHPKQFRRPLTWAQARARGYKGDRLMYVEGTLCKACSPATFRPTKMTPHEIEQAALNGRVSYARARIEIEKKQLRAAEHAHTLVSHRWEKALRSRWEALIFTLKQDRGRVRRTSSGLVGLFLLHREALRVAIAAASLHKRRADTYPPNLAWSDLIGIELYAKLINAHDAAQVGPDGPALRRLKHPLVFLHPPLQAQPLPPTDPNPQASACTTPRA